MLRRAAAKKEVKFEDLTELAREHDFHRIDIKTMNKANGSGRNQGGKEEEQLNAVRSFKALKCWKCFGSHAARDCGHRVLCQTCKNEDPRKTSHCTKAHTEWNEWKKTMEAKAGGATARPSGGAKRSGGAMPPGQPKRPKASDFFEKNNINKEEKSKFWKTVVKLLDHKEEEEEE